MIKILRYIFLFFGIGFLAFDLYATQNSYYEKRGSSLGIQCKTLDIELNDYGDAKIIASYEIHIKDREKKYFSIPVRKTIGGIRLTNYCSPDEISFIKSNYSGEYWIDLIFTFGKLRKLQNILNLKIEYWAYKAVTFPYRDKYSSTFQKTFRSFEFEYNFWRKEIRESEHISLKIPEYSYIYSHYYLQIISKSPKRFSNRLSARHSSDYPTFIVKYISKKFMYCVSIVNLLFLFLALFNNIIIYSLKLKFRNGLIIFIILINIGFALILYTNLGHSIELKLSEIIGSLEPNIYHVLLLIISSFVLIEIVLMKTLETSHSEYTLPVRKNAQKGILFLFSVYLLGSYIIYDIFLVKIFLSTSFLISDLILIVAFILLIIVRPKYLWRLIYEIPQIMKIIIQSIKLVGNQMFRYIDPKFLILKLKTKRLRLDWIIGAITLILGVLALYYSSEARRQKIIIKNNYNHAYYLMNRNMNKEAIEIFEELFNKGYYKDFPNLSYLLGLCYEWLPGENEEHLSKSIEYYQHYIRNYDSMIKVYPQDMKVIMPTDDYVQVIQKLEQASRKNKCHDLEVIIENVYGGWHKGKPIFTFNFEGINHSLSSVWNVVIKSFISNKKGEILESIEHLPLVYSPELKIMYGVEFENIEIKKGDILTFESIIDFYDVVKENNEDNNKLTMSFKIPEDFKDGNSYVFKPDKK